MEKLLKSNFSIEQFLNAVQVPFNQWDFFLEMNGITGITLSALRKRI
jgi:hypothetical protein